jgi:hypothetical protein
MYGVLGKRGKLQLFFPDLKVWLDVDELHDISELE